MIIKIIKNCTFVVVFCVFGELLTKENTQKKKEAIGSLLYMVNASNLPYKAHVTATSSSMSSVACPENDGGTAQDAEYTTAGTAPDGVVDVRVESGCCGCSTTASSVTCAAAPRLLSPPFTRGTAAAAAAAAEGEGIGGVATAPTSLSSCVSAVNTSTFGVPCTTA